MPGGEGGGLAILGHGAGLVAQPQGMVPSGPMPAGPMPGFLGLTGGQQAGMGGSMTGQGFSAQQPTSLPNGGIVGGGMQSSVPEYLRDHPPTAGPSNIASLFSAPPQQQGQMFAQPPCPPDSSPMTPPVLHGLCTSLGHPSSHPASPDGLVKPGGAIGSQRPIERASPLASPLASPSRVVGKEPASPGDGAADREVVELVEGIADTGVADLSDKPASISASSAKSLDEMPPLLAAADPPAAAAPASPAKGGITFLVHAEEDERRAPRIRRVSAAEMIGGVDAACDDLRGAHPHMNGPSTVAPTSHTLHPSTASLGLPAAATFLYLAPEFDEWVAMEDLCSLPEKCRVRVVLPEETPVDGKEGSHPGSADSEEASKASKAGSGGCGGEGGGDGGGEGRGEDSAEVAAQQRA